MPDYKVKQGDCIESIAFRHNLFWETIWNHPKNSSLKERRKNPNILYPGDVVFIPDKEEKQEEGATEQRHRFRQRGVPGRFRLRLLDDGQPRVNESYTLEIDGRLLSGTTDSEGRLEHSIPPGARQGKLILMQTNEEYPLNLGGMDPIDEVSGIQARLNNLGFNCGEVDGVLGPKTRAAIREFQRKFGLTESGEVDEATRGRLVEIHSS